MGVELAIERFDVNDLPEVIKRNRGKSIGISYLPESLKTAYLYIYIPNSGEKGSRLGVIQACQKAECKIEILTEELYDAENQTQINLSRALFDGAQVGFCRIDAANLDRTFVTRTFCAVTEVMKQEPSSSQGTLLNRRQTL